MDSGSDFPAAKTGCLFGKESMVKKQEGVQWIYSSPFTALFTFNLLVD